MKLPYGWRATWEDGPQRVVLRKATRAPLYLHWEPPHLKAIDRASGILITGLTTALPDDVRGPLIAAALARWGA